MTLLSLDSSFLIDFLSGETSAVEKMRQIESDGNMIAVSSVAVYELLVLSAGDRQAKRTQKALNMVESLLSRIGIIWSFEADTARLAAEIQRTQMVKGKPISVRDLFIAASSLANGCNVVVTRNVRDFMAIDGIRVETY